ncbi:MAG: Gfo/Idh/MocA family oxidoreductase [Anaerolineae bacterium]|nr:Gfo/Idh/MocA family oxidoreductase [Anaerolineae bacterium]
MVNVGIIGCGGVARAHARAIGRFPDRAKLVAVADVVEEQRRPFAEQYGAMAYSRAEDLLAAGDVNCVVISLPHDLHASYAVMAAQAGKDILLEKPMAANVGECDEILEAVERAGVKLSVGHSYRYYDGCQAAKAILDSGEVGDLVFAISTFSKNWGIDKRRGWHLERGRGGGMWQANGIHSVNTLMWFAGSPVVAVKGSSALRFHTPEQMDADDASMALLQHANGAHTVSLVTGYRRGAPKDMVELTCTGGMLRCERKRLWVGLDEQWTERPVETEDDKVREWAEFLTYLEGSGPCPVPGTEARHTVQVLKAVEQSSTTGREIRLDKEVERD